MPLYAQTTTAMLQDLKGTWYEEGRETATFAAWQPLEDQTWLLRTWQMNCGVMTELSRASIQVEAGQESMTVWINADNQKQTFRLSQTTDDAMVWENTDPNTFPKQVTWSFSDGGAWLIN